ncbi:1127_t:CDS:2, partial [Cetraspora pellucida]
MQSLYAPFTSPLSTICKKKQKISGKKGDTLPDGTKIEKATPLDLLQSDDDNHSSQEDNDDHPTQEDNNEDEGIPDPKDTVINNSKKWNLPSGLYVGEIFDENVSANAEKAKNKKKITIYEKAILRYGASNIIDLSVPQLAAEENSFISKVESMVLKGDVN